MIYALLLTVVLNDTSICREKYLNLVLESQNYGRYYLCVNVNTGYEKKEVIVLNYDLYKYLSNVDKGLKPIAKYRDFVKDKLIENEPLQITNEGLKVINAVYVITDSSVILAAQKGQEYFFSQFFEYKGRGKLKTDLESEKISQIEKILFNWSYPIGKIEGLISVLDMKPCLP